MEPDTGRVREISLSHDPEILTDSTSEGDWAIEEAPSKSREQESKKKAPTKGSVGMTKGGAVIFPTGPTGGKTLEGQGSGKELVVRGLAGPQLSTKEGVVKEMQKEASRKVAILKATKVPAPKKAGLPSNSEHDAAKTVPTLKGSQGSSMKMGSMEGKHVKKQEDDDVYAMDTYVRAVPGGADAKKTRRTEATPSKDNIVNIVVSPKRSTKPSEKVEAVGREDDACTHVRCADTSDIPGSPIIPGSSKLVVFNVHRTKLDYNLFEEKNPNTKIKPTLKAVGRQVICRP
jgi:hypothetical protein